METGESRKQTQNIKRKVIIMNTKTRMGHARTGFRVSTGFLVAFVIWTVLVRIVDVQAIGPEGSSVGFATLNRFVHELTGENLFLYVLTDLLSILPLAFVPAFGVLGLCQLIHRKSLRKVDRSILVLGGFYAAVLACFLFFEVCVINYRPLLIEGVLEASYPSSTTMLVMCVMPTAMMQLRDRIENKTICRVLLVLLGLFTAFMVIGRLVSGVHWFSDILGGALLSAGLVGLYVSFNRVGTDAEAGK